MVYQWSFKRSKRDDKAINAQIARAEKVAAGKAPLARTRFVKVTGATKEQVAAAYPRVQLHVVCDNYSTHKHWASSRSVETSPLGRGDGEDVSEVR